MDRIGSFVTFPPAFETAMAMEDFASFEVAKIKVFPTKRDFLSSLGRKHDFSNCSSACPIEGVNLETFGIRDQGLMSST